MRGAWTDLPGPIRRVLYTSIVLWALAMLLTGLWSVDVVFPGVSCPPFSGDSDYGTSQWRWSGLGDACIYDTTDGRHVDEPSSARWGEGLLLATWLGLTLAVVKAVRKSSSVTQNAASS
jgi:hypothetical protein